MTASEIEALGGYYGATPKPADFEAFWQARMAEADAVPLDYTVTQAKEVPSWDGCDFLDLWFTGMAGARIYAKYLRPHSDKPVPLVLQFHGYPGASRSFAEQASFAGMGMALIAMDCPGQAGYSVDAGGFFGHHRVRAHRRRAGRSGRGHVLRTAASGHPHFVPYRAPAAGDRPAAGVRQRRLPGRRAGLLCAEPRPHQPRRHPLPVFERLQACGTWARTRSPTRASAITPAGLTPTSTSITAGSASWAISTAKALPPWCSARCCLVRDWRMSSARPRPSAPSTTICTAKKKRYLFPGYGHEEIAEFDDMLLAFFCKEEAVL